MATAQLPNCRFKQVNGILLPGGGACLHGGCGYYDVSKKLLELTIQANDRGEIVPVKLPASAYQVHMRIYAALQIYLTAISDIRLTICPNHADASHMPWARGARCCSQQKHIHSWQVGDGKPDLFPCLGGWLIQSSPTLSHFPSFPWFHHHRWDLLCSCPQLQFLQHPIQAEANESGLQEQVLPGVPSPSG